MECGDVFLGGFEDKQDHIFEASAVHAKTQRGVTTEILRQVWGISLDEARQTLQVKTQLNKQDVDPGISCRFREDNFSVSHEYIIHQGQE